MGFTDGLMSDGSAQRIKGNAILLFTRFSRMLAPFRRALESKVPIKLNRVGIFELDFAFQRVL